MIGLLWAELVLPDYITFYSEATLAQKGILGALKGMQKDYKTHQEWITLDPPVVDALAQAGVAVQKVKFPALKSAWHWFTNAAPTDAFHLTTDQLTRIQEQGHFTVMVPRKPPAPPKEPIKPPKQDPGVDAFTELRREHHKRSKKLYGSLKSH